MDRDTFIQKAVEEMIANGTIIESKGMDAIRYLGMSWTAGWEYYRRYEAHHDGNVHAVVHFNRDDKNMGTYPSVSEASRKLKIPRKTLCSVLNGSVRRMRNGQYFKYIEQCETNETIS